MPPSVAKKVVTAPSTTASGVEEEPPSGGVADEVGQVAKDAQLILPSAPLVV